MLDADLITTRLGPAVLPYERGVANKPIGSGEDILFLDHIMSLNTGVIPAGCLRCEMLQPMELPANRKYLWIIDHKGLRIILEATPNPLADRRCVCHTNITGGASALQGGELWFDTSDQIHLNYKSGRYGDPTPDQQQAVLDYFRQVGFTVIRLSNRTS
jgi:hypothetical protein